MREEEKVRVFKNGCVTGQSGQHKQISKQVLERMQRKGNRGALLAGMQTGAATEENGIEFPQKTKNGTIASQHLH